MQAAHSDHANLIKQQEQSPAVFPLACSLKATSDPVPFTKGSDRKMNKAGGDFGPTKKKETTKVVETIKTDETMLTKPLICDDEDNELIWTAHYMKPSCETSVDAPKRISMRRSIQKESLKDEIKRTSAGQIYYKSNNNNNYGEDLMAETNAAFLKKFLHGSDSSHWKREHGATGDFIEDLRVRFPWKRIAYIGILLVLGITCAILALMKVCGGADWMNTATFSVIIMGTIMLLPPGLYYGRILICISCRCKGYTLWDVPAGPFG